MKHSKLMLSLLAAIMLIAFVVILSAQVPRRFAEKPRFPHQAMEQRLNLTEEQQSKMADLRLAHQREMLPLQTELQGKMAELRLLKTEPNPNLNKIDQVIEQTEKIRTKLQKTRARHQLEIRKILTPEQQKLWDSRTLQGPGQRMMGRKLRFIPEEN